MDKSLKDRCNDENVRRGVVDPRKAREALAALSDEQLAGYIASLATEEDEDERDPDWDGLDPDVRMARYLHAQLVEFRVDAVGTPMDYFSEEALENLGQDEAGSKASHQRYLDDIDKIIATFDFIGHSDDYTNVDRPETQEGLALFAKLFTSFWH